MSEHIDPLSASLSVTRDRQQLAPHVRAIEVQILDALLRIEELLTKQTRAKALDDLAQIDADIVAETSPVTKPKSRFSRK